MAALPCTESWRNMVFKRFRIQIVLRVIGIGLSAWAFAWSIYLTDFLMTPIVFAMLTMLQMALLIYYIEKSLKEIRRFSESFIDSDYMRKFDESERGKAFKELGDTFNHIIDDFKRIRIEKEEHYRYLLQVNDHVNVGLICFKEGGRIDLMNKAAASLLNTPMLDRMEHLENRHEEFHELLLSMNSGDKQLYHSTMTEEARDLAIVANKFKLKNEEYTLVSLQDIRSELDANEMTAWQKLIRVLTHEIMNSVTPISSLAAMMETDLSEFLNNDMDLNQLKDDTVEDFYLSVKTIHNRSES